MSDPHIITILTAKYARLSGQLRNLERQSEGLRRDIAHVEATLRLFRRDWDGEGVSPIAPRKSSRWGDRGEGVTLIFRVLREAEGPLTTTEIVRRVFALRGLPEPEGAALRVAASPVHNALRNRDGVVCEGQPKRWALER